MSEIEPEAIVAYIEQHTESSPPREAKDVQRLFRDFDSKSIDTEIADLWKWGIVELKREGGEQFIQLSEFGEELEELGVSEMYINAKLGIVPNEDQQRGPEAVRVLDG